MNRAWAIAVATLGLAACGQQPAEHPLDGRWEVQQIADAPLGDGVDIWVEFDEVAEIVNGFTGCNNFSASISTYGSMVSFGPVNEAPGDCPSEAAATDEARFLTVLPAVQRYGLRGDSLELLQPAQGSEALVRLRRVEPAGG